MEKRKKNIYADIAGKLELVRIFYQAELNKYRTLARIGESTTSGYEYLPLCQTLEVKIATLDIIIEALKF